MTNPTPSKTGPAGTSVASDAEHGRAIQYGQLLPLYAAQALATGATTVSTVLASLIMSSLGSEGLSGLPSTLIQAAAAFSASAFGSLMLRAGRRTGLVRAFALGAVGALVGFLGSRLQVIPLFLLGASMMGAAQGGYQQARYAVAEGVPESRRGTALGILMLMSVAGSFLITGASHLIEELGRILNATAETAGWLVGGGLLGVAALLMLTWRSPRSTSPSATRSAPQLSVVAAFKLPGVRSTALALATAQGLMVTLMSLTPLRAHHMGMDHAGIAALISGHILGMFGFGWLTGPLVDRFGLKLGYVGGALLLTAAALTAPLMGATWLAVSMFLLGFGWNLTYVSATKALARTPVAQGATDSLGFITAGLGTLLGGLLISRTDFSVLAYLCAALALLPLVSAWRVGRNWAGQQR
ncbi:MFS transporter [Deinococcus yavapaiensis]|uniref:Putative MFS family arabinose efflux permease n=1 Tax=Deinococcus yavapaiensis KR-236 TaxID=694435 RepID=A0A318SDG3_9DEIO|nr:MFS transporter [Deinococcus yavapaiensis]PYE50438.1 putative MFS family arabinose efflux permease [Deinococcus yavapaiensis KR-236]